MRLSLALLTCAVLAGCAQSTSVLYVELVMDPQAPPPAALALTVFDAHGVVGREVLDPTRLPGTLVVRSRWDAPRTLRLNATGTGKAAVAGSARVVVEPGGTAHTQILLLGNVQDRDGDGVVDGVDVCPADPDPDQQDTDGDGVGDACAPGATQDLPAVAFDLAGDRGTPTLGCAQAAAATMCDDFESGAWKPFWAATTVGATIAVDELNARSGTHALHVHVPATTAQNVAIGAKLDDAQHLATLPAVGERWIRAYYFLPAVPPDGPNLMNVGQSMTPWRSVDLYVTGGGKPALTSDQPPGGVSYATSPLPTGRWVCVETHLTIGASSSAEVRVDDAVVATLSLGTGAPSPPLSLLSIGFQYYATKVQGLPALDAWVDDVVLAPSPIGCGS